MSQSPIGKKITPENTDRYRQGWKALNRLLHEDRSFSGFERNCAYLNIKGNRFAVGSFKPGKNQFTNYSIDVNKGDVVYLFSDGYADQFGGDKGKKFMNRPFRELLLEIATLPMEKQKNILHQRMEDWRGEHEQIDDILVIGFRIS